MRRYLALFLAPFLMLALSIRAESGDTPTTAPLRIISCAPNLTEMVFALGMGEHVVGVSTFTDYPPEAADLPAVVDLFQPNIEAMLQLGPTMILALQSNARVIDFFSQRSRVNLVVMEELETLEQINEALLKVGRALGRESKAREIIASQPEPEPRDPAVRPPRVLIVVGHGPGLSQLYATGHGTFLHELMTRAGARNAVPEELGKYPVLNKEALIRLDPEIILIMVPENSDIERRYADAQREWRRLPSITAVRGGDFRFIVGKDMVIPGPRAPFFLPLFEELIWETEPGGSVSGR